MTWNENMIEHISVQYNLARDSFGVRYVLTRCIFRSQQKIILINHNHWQWFVSIQQVWCKSYISTSISMNFIWVGSFLQSSLTEVRFYLVLQSLIYETTAVFDFISHEFKITIWIIMQSYYLLNDLYVRFDVIHRKKNR